MLDPLLWKLRENLEAIEKEERKGRTALDSKHTKEGSEEADFELDILEKEGLINVEEYICPTEQDIQYDLMKQLNKMKINITAEESEEEKGMNSDVHETIWQFMKFISTRLEEEKLTSIFRKENMNPTGDLVSRMLSNHKLRTSFDFEKALSREVGFKVNRGLWVNREEESGQAIAWSPRILDAVAGEGTTASAIFELKECGWFRGAKRRLKFVNMIDTEKRAPKQLKTTEMENLIKNLSISPNETQKKKGRREVSVNIGQSVAGWHGYKKSPEKLMPKKEASTPTSCKRSQYKKSSLRKKKMCEGKVVGNSSGSSQNASQGLIPGYFNYAPRVSGTDAAVTGRVSTSRAKPGGANVKHPDKPQ